MKHLKGEIWNEKDNQHHFGSRTDFRRGGYGCHDGICPEPCAGRGYAVILRFDKENQNRGRSSGSFLCFFWGNVVFVENMG